MSCDVGRVTPQYSAVAILPLFVEWSASILQNLSIYLSQFSVSLVDITMPKRCSVGGCSNTPSDTVSVFAFPREPDLRKRWEEPQEEVGRSRYGQGGKNLKKKWEAGNLVCIGDDFLSYFFPIQGVTRSTSL